MREAEAAKAFSNKKEKLAPWESEVNCFSVAFMDTFFFHNFFGCWYTRWRANDQDYYQQCHLA
jgi:hypothetical protein